MLKDFVSIDLETTGLLPKEDRIIEIGAVKYRNAVEIDCFHTMINPERVLPERITELTGIKKEELEGQPKIQEVLKELLLFLGDDVMMAHHISTDYAFLKRAVLNFTQEKKGFEKKGIDTLKIARQCLTNLESKSLSALCDYYKIEGRAHRALEDARATAEIYLKMAAEFESGREKLFEPATLVYKIKKESPASKVQKERLYRLLKLHKITPEYDVEGLTRNEASRYQDRILSEFGR